MGLSPESKSPNPRIEVYEYFAYNGGFARKRTLLWHFRMYGVNGERWTDPSGWNGHQDKSFAVQHAKHWAAFTGWPVVDLGRHEAYDHQARF